MSVNPPSGGQAATSIPITIGDPDRFFLLSGLTDRGRYQGIFSGGLNVSKRLFSFLLPLISNVTESSIFWRWWRGRFRSCVFLFFITHNLIFITFWFWWILTFLNQSISRWRRWRRKGFLGRIVLVAHNYSFFVKLINYQFSY